MSADKPVLTIDRPEEGIARIGLNRPEKRNALDPELRLALIAGIESVLEDSSVRAVILAGNGGLDQGRVGDRQADQAGRLG